MASANPQRRGSSHGSLPGKPRKAQQSTRCYSTLEMVQRHHRYDRKRIQEKYRSISEVGDTKSFFGTENPRKWDFGVWIVLIDLDRPQHCHQGNYKAGVCPMHRTRNPSQDYLRLVRANDWYCLRRRPFLTKNLSTKVCWCMRTPGFPLKWVNNEKRWNYRLERLADRWDFAWGWGTEEAH